MANLASLELALLSCDINLAVKCKVEKLLGKLPGEVEPGLPEPKSPPQLFAVLQIAAQGEVLGIQTSSLLGEHVDNQCVWDQWRSCPVKYRDLPVRSQLAVTVWQIREGRSETPLGGAVLPLFSKKGHLKTGRRKVRLWLGKEADVSEDSSTPGKLGQEESGSLERAERALRKYERGLLPRAPWLDRLALQSLVELQELEEARWLDQGHVFVFLELPCFHYPVVFHEQTASSAAPQQVCSGMHSEGLVWMVDTEMGFENPSVAKQIKLARSVARGVIDRDLKPDVAERRHISALLRLPPTRPLPLEGKQLLWKFRFSLREDKTALTKFLKCVDWSDAHETKQAVELMHQWACIETTDALQLLSPSFTNQEVRAHAVAMLDKTSDGELLGYLLQLVQALRHEAHNDSHLLRFLIQRATRNPQLANYLHWFLSVEWEDPIFGPRFLYAHKLFSETQITCDGGVKVWEAITKQNELTSQLCTIVSEISQVRGTSRKVEKLQSMISEGGLLGKSACFDGIPLPLDPLVQLRGMVPSESGVFKSAMHPLKLVFRTESADGDQGEQIVIFKKGDDLRQDQLCVQMISLMDHLLKKENLDLRLTPYNVIATGTDNGMVEFVPSHTLASVLDKHKAISKFLSQHNPDPSGPYGMQAEVLETFIKSCAGYCVITYIMGVGDRHLDNLLLTTDGRLFHIDFGYIMGRDPKPLPPPMKLCKEMVEAMGGTDSENYARFKSYCCEAYNILRKSANLIINLFLLMSGANIPDISADPEKTILKLESKFVLDLDDEAAVQHFQALIQESVTALFPQMMETAHRWAQYWR